MLSFLKHFWYFILLGVFSLFFFVVILLVSIPKGTKQNSIIPTPTPIPISGNSVTANNLVPLDIPTVQQTTVDSFYPNISVSFSQPVSPGDQKKVLLTINPNVDAKIGWSDTNDTIFLAFPNALSPNQTYIIKLVVLGKTYSWQVVTPAQESVDENSQPILDEKWANAKHLIKALYPWYDLLPLQDTGYFVYFDTDKKSFYANLYPSQSSPVSVNQQAADLKKAVSQALLNLSPDTKKYPVVWNVSPTP